MNAQVKTIREAARETGVVHEDTIAVFPTTTGAPDDDIASLSAKRPARRRP